jgi:OPA family glycerol-3-phosphate transporter-like MFS transporter
VAAKSSPSEHAPADQQHQLRRWRVKVFLGTWLSYAGYYFCRKPFYKVKGTLHEQLAIPTPALGHIGTAYLAAYSAGQFNAAAIGTRLGPRRMLLVGMALSVLCNAAAGALPGFWSLIALMTINGVAQATGWPGNVGTMAHWTRRQERGTIMGFWSTNYQVGGLLAGLTASFLLGRFGWQSSFFGGAVVLSAIIGLFAVLQRDRPEDVGLPALDDQTNATDASSRAGGESEAGAGDRVGWDRQVLITLLLMGATYFGVKFVRYLLLSWAAFFLQVHFKLRKDHAGYIADIFDLAGTAGTITAGVVSDRVFGGRRTPVILGMLALMTLSCLLLWQLGGSSVTLFAVGLGLVGFMIYGPDSLLSAAGAIDVGRSGGAVAAAGIINGIGAAGSVLQEEVVGQLYRGASADLSSVFGVLFASSVASLICVSVLAWRARQGKSTL